jgi:hypothetical protein
MDGVITSLRAAIEGRLTGLRAEKDQMLANANACNGAIQNMEWVLRFMQEQEAKAAALAATEADYSADGLPAADDEVK